MNPNNEIAGFFSSSIMSKIVWFILEKVKLAGCDGICMKFWYFLLLKLLVRLSTIMSSSKDTYRFLRHCVAAP